MAEPSLADIIAGRSREHRVLRSPGGTTLIVLHAIEAFNSQWVEAASIHRTADLALLVQVGEWNWHLDQALWDGDEVVTLYLRRFPGDSPGLVLTLDLQKRIGRPQQSEEVIPLDELNGWLELWYQMHRGQR